MNYQINSAAVIGAGVMGAGIAAVIANAGIPVCLLDIVPPTLTDEDREKGLNEASPAFRNKFSLSGLKRISDPKRGALHASELSGLITVGNLEDDLELLQGCDWIVEVVLEDLQVKQDLLTKIAPFVGEGAIVSSNTSGVSITSIAAEMPESFRKRFLGTHFFNPPQIMQLFELIPGADTDSELVQFMADFAKKRLGKGVVLAKDTPNFIGNRIGVYAFASVYTAAQEFGYDVETADALTGTVLGRPASATFRTIDMVGLDVLHHVCANLEANLPAEEATIFAFPPALQSLYDAGYLGDKTRGGSYKSIRGDGPPKRMVWDGKDYVPAKKPEIKVLAETAKLPFAERIWAIIDSGTDEGRFVWRIVKEILLYATNRVPEITDDHKAIDRAMEWGYNWKLGPFALWDALGIERMAQRLKVDGAVFPEWISAHVESALPFYTNDEEAETCTIIQAGKAADIVALGDGVLGLNMHPKGSAINEELLNLIHSAIDVLEAYPENKGLVLYSSGKSFLNGADLFSILDLIQNNKWDDLEVFVDRFQATAMRLKYAAKPIVAAVHGMALGGGAEFAMHCARVIAHSDAKFGLVESGVGVIPSGGGTKETTYRWLKKLESVRGADVYPFLQKAWNQIATAAISRNAVQARELCYLRDTDRIVMDLDSLLAEAKAEALRMATDGYHRAYPLDIRLTGHTGYAYLSNITESRLTGRFISEYDAHILREIAKVMTGGDAPQNAVLTEDQLLALEKQGFVGLCRQQKTADRIEHMLQTGKPLRN